MANKFPQMPEGGFAKLGGFRQMNGFGGFKDECDGTCEHKDEFYKGVIDFPALIKDLDGSKYGSPINDQKFNYELYKGKLDVYNPSPDGLGGVWSKEGAELEYIDSITGRKNKTNLRASLNKVVCCIDTVFNYRIRVSAEKISYGITYHYKDAAGEESLVDHYQDRDRYTIDEKYVAIHIHSENAEDIIQVLKRINRETFIEDFKKLVGKYFQQALLATTEKADLNELYKKAPLFALEWLAGPGQFTSVMWQEHLPLLLSYDNSGLLSFVRDSSHAVVNLLQGIKDMRFLYDELKKNPGLIKTIYFNMDGSSTFKGTEISNRKIFSSLLNAICYHNIDKCTRTGERFYVDDTRKPDSNLNSGNDIYKDKIFLAQLTKRTFKEEIIIDGDDRPNSAGQGFEVPVSRFQPDDGGKYYHPMDMVVLQDENGLQVEVTALFVKDIADELEWAEIMEGVRLGINIFAMVVSLATLMAGPGAFLFVLSTIDLALAGSDTVIQGLKDELAKTEGGREFLAIWEKVYVIGGIATAGPLVVTGLFSAGARLWAKLSSGAARDFVAAVLTRIVMELRISSFERSAFRIIPWEEVRVLSPGTTAIRASVCKGMEELGIVMGIGRSAETGEDLYFILWKGDVVEAGDFVKVRGRLTEIMRNGVSKAVEWLDNFVRKTGKVPYGENKMSNFAIEYRKKLEVPSHPGNIAVFEFINNEGRKEFKAFSTFKDENAWLAAGYDSKPHAERIGVNELKIMGIPNENVLAVYSELQPCLLEGHACDQLLKARFPQADISYSFSYPGFLPKDAYEVFRHEAIKLRGKALSFFLKG
ncbi:hypothetical protein JMG10_19365 [Nostoc ellipsosporum NOK]|nr:hypothetical protein [Nostoc ellipsosporum NOK]